MCSDWTADYENIDKYSLHIVYELQCPDPKFSFFGPGPDLIFGSQGYNVTWLSYKFYTLWFHHRIYRSLQRFVLYTDSYYTGTDRKAINDASVPVPWPVQPYCAFVPK